METYYAINSDGTYERIVVSVQDLYKKIVEKVGSPFDVVQLGERIHLYVRDEGLFDGSELNVPLAVMMALPICGPILVAGIVSPEGNSLGVDEVDPFITTIVQVCENLTEARKQVDHNREHPFTLYDLTTGEEI